MEKKVWVWISLIASVLMLIILILSRYEVLRKFELSMRSTEYYLKKYKTLPKADPKNRVVVCMYTKIPEEITDKFLRSLLDQTVRVDELILNINSKDRKRLGNVENVLSVYPQKKSYGMIYSENDDTLVNGKLLNTMIPVLLTELDLNTKIVVLKSCKILDKDSIETLLDESLLYPNDILESDFAFLIRPGLIGKKFSDVKTVKGLFGKNVIRKI